MRVLLRAIRTLPQADQDAVLTLLLSGLAGQTEATAGPAGLATTRTWRSTVQFRDANGRAITALSGLNAADGDSRVVPIRFPLERYDQLKTWCREHNFPMAAVVRGLVERFLDGDIRPR